MIERLLRNPAGLAFLALAVVILIGSTVSFVPETRQGVVVRFGQPVRIINAYKPGENFGATGAGIIVRIPFAEKIQWLDKRVQSIDMDEQEVLSTDQLRLQVDAFARYRIVDPLKMYKTARTEERLGDALRPLLGSSLRNELGKEPFAALLSPERGKVMANIKDGLNREARQYGAEVIDVRIKRAEGWKTAQVIRATADAEAAKIYAAAFGKDPQFYDFYRAMQSYKTTFGVDGTKQTGTTNLILSPSNDYLREFRGGQ